MIADDRPMLPMHENGIALYRTYRSMPARPGSEFPPWQIALLDWWQFIGRRQAMRLLRAIRRGGSAGKLTPSNQAE